MINNISHIIEAVELGEHSFSTLRGVVVERTTNGDVFCIAGGESVVLKVVVDGDVFAMKCYTNQRVGLKERYDILKDFSIRHSFIPDMNYLDKELLIVDNYGAQMKIDILLYRWIDGVTLLEAIEKRVEFYDTRGLLSLCHQTALLGCEFLSLPINHGDIKPQNIIVSDDGDMVLIDYDMLFSDDMPCSDIVRTQWFQHPLSESWDEGYSFAVIVVSIFLLSLDTLLFHRCHNGENIILDTYKITNLGVLNREIIALLEPYPNYKALFDVISFPKPCNRDVPSLLANIYGVKPTNSSVVDADGVLRRVVCSNGFYGFVDSGDKLVVGCCYSDATLFNDGVAGVCLNGVWYIINNVGYVVSKEVYEEVGESRSGVIPICRGGKWFYVNSSTFAPICGDSYGYAYPFSCGIGLVRCGDKFFFVDANGEALFGAKEYTFARPFIEGYAIVAGEKYYVIDIYGRQIVDSISEQILSYDGNMLICRGEDGAIMTKFCDK